MGADYYTCEICGDNYVSSLFAECDNQDCQEKYICLWCYKEIEGHPFQYGVPHPDCCFCTKDLKRRRFTKDEMWEFILTKYQITQQSIINEMKSTL